MFAPERGFQTNTGRILPSGRCGVGLPLVAVALALLLTGLCCGQAAAEQTREQCNSCCAKQGLDEYYLEQCKLKCFRSPEHCTDKKAESVKPPTQEPSPRRPPVQQAPVQPPLVQQPSLPPPPMQQQTVQPPPQQPIARPPVQQEPMLQQPPQQQPAEAQPPRRRSAFQWPNPLNLEPGKEWQAAAQILGLNGIPPDHPNYQRALKGVEIVLTQFARSNPQGGQLPTTELEKIIRQNR